MDRGKPDSYEVIWKSGHIDCIEAHQISWPHRSSAWLDSSPSPTQVVHFHAEIEGRWTLVLSAPEEEIVTIRNLTRTNNLP